MNYLQGVDHLLTHEAFYGCLLSLMDKVYDSKVTTCGVSIDKSIKLYINEQFFSQFKKSEVAAILKHECLHVIFEPMNRFKDLEDGKYKNQKNFNIAADLAINQLIPQLPKKGVVFINGKEESVEFVSYEKYKELIPDLLPNNTAEYYYKKLCEAAENGTIPSSNEEGHGDHSKWGEGETNEELKKSLLKDVIKDAMQTSGKTPSELSELIKELFENKINWKSILRNYIANATSISKVATRKKRNRRYGILTPGKKKDPKFKLALCVDTSGSMYEEQFKQILSEVANIYNMGNTVIILMADTEVQSVIEYKGEKELDFKGRGGTLYSPALKKADELKADVILYFGDMDNYDKENVYKPKSPVIWCSVNGQEPPVKWGKRLEIQR